jgi:hypothetical protein
LAKTSRSSGDVNTQKLLNNRGLIGDLTGVTFDGSDRLKKTTRPDPVHALASDAPPQI